MKHINIPLFLFALFLVSSCEPLEGLYDEMDAAANNYHVSNINDTLTTNDYKNMKGDVEKYLSFSKSTLAADYIPDYLAEKYPALGPASRAAVSYVYYPGNSMYLDKLPEADTYTLLPSDYTEGTSPTADIPELLATKFPDAENDDIYIVHYNYKGKSTSVYILTDGKWKPQPKTYMLTDDDYTTMGTPGEDNSFNSTDTPEHFLPIYLKSRYSYAKAGNIKLVLYNYLTSDNTTETRGLEYQYDGIMWNNLSSSYLMTEEYVFKNDKWIPAPELKFVKSTKAHTVEYTLDNDDYALVENGKYNNFDVRDGKAEASEEVRINKFTTILKAKFLDLAVGQVYKVSYKVFNETSETWELTLEVVEANEEK